LGIDDRACTMRVCYMSKDAAQLRKCGFKMRVKLLMTWRALCVCPLV